MRNRPTKEPRKVSYRRVIRYYSVPSDDKTHNPTSYRPCLTFIVRVKSSNLWTKRLTQIQKDNYEEIKRLRKEGLTYKQISSEMNRKVFTPTRTKKFTPQLVHGIEKKMDKRIKRITRVFEPKIDEMDIVFEDIVIHKRKKKEYEKK